MTRILLLLLALASGLSSAALAQSLPARPEPFTFVTDQAGLLSPADAQKLESGLRRYADQNGPQVVVVTVPSLGGRTVADYARALGNEWQVGQRGKNNGVVVLLSGQERKVSIQAGSGLQSAITPAVTDRIINQQMLPSFKQGNYFAGLRAGLNTLLLAANPASDPRRNAPAGTPVPGGGSDNFPALGGGDAASTAATPSATEAPTTPAETDYSAPAAEPAPSGGLGIGTILIGVLVIGGIGFLLLKMFRRNSGGSATGGTPGSSGPDFYGNQPNRNAGGNYNNGPGYQPGSSGPGIGGILATGAAAAAGAYLGNRMASGNDSNSLGHNYDSSSGAGLGTGMGAGAAAGSAGADTGPDYFSDTDAGSSSSADYFSDDNSSSGSDFSSDDMGGGGFDGGDDNSGSW
ncbi:TPM domain-containing protein [Hymenobacter sp. ASUV-10]|uniref:TPM domain-containing protein n=1 Tax=Hymenobacter aranciens TaxID=3063996 RepID=A0ABT9B5L9_9BACT|nr:TPM domain-containing protein [Hymenobacter sp. ASUV-10]MDO7873468.1 TPM domain-containing protein [Hymenobacter sp. ASUV-10]